MKTLNNKHEPYPLMWLSDEECPCFEDIGIGIGCLKVKGATHFSIPICPGVVVLNPQKDPIRKDWIPHGSSPIEPKIEPNDSLSLVKREWYPYKLHTEYKYKGGIIEQDVVVFKYGAQVKIYMHEANEFTLFGESTGPCKIWYDNEGMHVIETAPKVRPLCYVIRFNIKPDSIEIVPETIVDSLKSIAIYNSKASWSFSCNSDAQY